MLVRWRLRTHPLLTAPPGDVYALWVRAVRGGQQEVTGTQRHTADLSVHTHTAMFTAGLEGLPAAVHHPPQVTCLTLLSHADAGVRVAEQAVVAVELLVVVAWLQQGAGVPQLPGTHLTAATAVQHQAAAQRAGRGGCRAGTGLGTVLGHCR